MGGTSHSTGHGIVRPPQTGKLNPEMASSRDEGSTRATGYENRLFRRGRSLKNLARLGLSLIFLVLTDRKSAQASCFFIFSESYTAKAFLTPKHAVATI